jgi:hypothetical protein
VATARPETTGRKPRGQSEHDQTTHASSAAERLVYTVPEAGRLLGLSRNASYEAAKRATSRTYGSDASCWSPKSLSTACSK